MLMVKTYVGPSKVHGLGLFAAEPIRKGQLVWKFVPGVDMWMTEAALKETPEAFQEFMRTYAFKEKGAAVYILGVDNDRFQNCSSDPNIIEDANDVVSPITKAMIAARDIAKGEEILSDYRQWDDKADEKGIPK